MLIYLRSSLFDSPAQTLVNTVNTVGVMGKGIAAEFKAKFPDMFREYKKLCDSHAFQIGNLHLWKSSERWVLNFPTKATWRAPSRIDYIEKGLKKFSEVYEELGITSISFPPLGCGNGQLQWNQVRPIMENYLRSIPIPIYVHDRQVRPDFVPEHSDATASLPPDSFLDFKRDVLAIIDTEGAELSTFDRSQRYSLSRSEASIAVVGSPTSEHISLDALEYFWSALQVGVLIDAGLSDADESERYLLPVIARLPYIDVAEIERPQLKNVRSRHALYFSRPTKVNVPSKAVDVSSGIQCQLL